MDVATSHAFADLGEKLKKCEATRIECHAKAAAKAERAVALAEARTSSASTAKGECNIWCEDHPVDWGDKCYWKSGDCSACAACSEAENILPAGCMSWCDDHSTDWSVKCGWSDKDTLVLPGPCTACNECEEDLHDEGGTCLYNAGGEVLFVESDSGHCYRVTVGESVEQTWGHAACDEAAFTNCDSSNTCVSLGKTAADEQCHLQHFTNGDSVWCPGGKKREVKVSVEESADATALSASCETASCETATCEYAINVVVPAGSVKKMVEHAKERQAK